jgi:DNA-binding transcriptional LysR family regulator
MQKLFENRRTVVCRKGHPLSAARSLKALQNADWAITGVDYNVEDDIARLFESHHLARPNVVLQASSAMSIMVSLAHSDLLAMLPVQWEEFPLTRDALQVIRVREPLPAPAIVLIQRPDFPLTPAAEHLSDVMRRYGPI